MASKAVVDAVTERLGSPWNGLPVLGPNTEGEPPADAVAFLQIQFPVADQERMSTSHRFYRETGGFRIVVNGERGKGMAQILVWAEQLMVLFRDVKIGSIHYLMPSPPFLGDNNEEGNFYKASIVFPFTYDFSS